MPISRSIVPVKEVLAGVMKELRGKGRPSYEEIQRSWKKLVGIKAARHSWPRRLTKGRLLVEVENSGWIYTLTQEKGRILEGLTREIGESQIKELSFRIGEPKDAQA